MFRFSSQRQNLEMAYEDVSTTNANANAEIVVPANSQKSLRGVLR